MSSSSASYGNETDIEDFLLIVSAHLHYAPYLAGWQEFKDNIRRVLEHQPGWANVSPGRRKGEMEGWCTIVKKGDADAAYDNYSKSGGVLVHLFKTSRRSSKYGLLKCNCSPHFPGVSERSHSPNRSGIDSHLVNQTFAKAYSMSASPYSLPSPSPYQYGTYQYGISQQPAAYPTATYPAYAIPTQYAMPPSTAYSSNTSGLPVNVGGGAMLTEARGIFIGQLSYSVGPSELHALLSTVGTPIEYNLMRDSNGASKGSATAKFASAREANDAVKYLNGRHHMGTTITVRYDNNTTVVGQIEGPVIANGSNYSRR
ncbi:hypothetical protein EJ04DRAFT_539477 [Polyplosphaeria fusca]|uniref:RRM domain-containing protein n=1 Tax=Polyplosphaeria fusca TaxID=682080 RepID=A0A9P4RCZ1_9PLEO|nr:hypothetical protein EJ04DRAFT_539477 [Polyplosphaeria fusca]